MLYTLKFIWCVTMYKEKEQCQYVNCVESVIVEVIEDPLDHHCEMLTMIIINRHPKGQDKIDHRCYWYHSSINSTQVTICSPLRNFTKCLGNSLLSRWSSADEQQFLCIKDVKFCGWQCKQKDCKTFCRPLFWDLLFWRKYGHRR